MKIHETYVKRYFTPQEMGLNPTLRERLFDEHYFLIRDKRAEEIRKELEQVEIFDMREYISEHYGVSPSRARAFMHRNALRNYKGQEEYKKLGILSKLRREIGTLKEDLEQILLSKK